MSTCRKCDQAIDQLAEIAVLQRKIESLSDHNRVIKFAKRLQYTCPMCWAKPFVWCHYVTNIEIETINLHVNRRG